MKTLLKKASQGDWGGEIVLEKLYLDEGRCGELGLVWCWLDLWDLWLNFRICEIGFTE